jgi:hypothetical protein
MPLRTTVPAAVPGVNPIAAETRSADAGGALPRRDCSTSRAAAFRKCRCPLGLIGMLAMIGAMECFVAPRANVSAPIRRVELSWQDSARAALSALGHADVLCLGDSRIKLGLLPRVLEHRLGVSAYNLGMLGAQAPSSYFLLQRVLERGIRPRALIVDFSENLLTFAPSRNAVCWADWMGWRESLDVAWQSEDPALAVSTALHGLLPGWCDQSDRSPLLGFGSKMGASSYPADDSRIFERNWRMNRGAQVAPREFVAVAETQAEAGGIWRPHPANTFYVDQLLRMAEGCRIAVYWILPPSAPAHRERLERNGVSTAFRRFVAERVAEFPSLSVLDGERLGWSVQAFRDPLHVNRDGAVRLSLAVAAATAPRLRGALSSPRWIDLVEIDDQESGKYQNLVEDLDQSRAAIEPILVGQSSGEATPW